ncbi:hypothetical protein N306_11676, partial [Opisthocomus hoazin]
AASSVGDASPKSPAPQSGHGRDLRLSMRGLPTNRELGSLTAARSAGGTGPGWRPGRCQDAPKPRWHSSRHGMEGGPCPRGRSCSSSHSCCPSASSVHTGRRCRTLWPCGRQMAWAGQSQTRRYLCQLSRTCYACTGRRCPGSSSSHRR